MNETVHVEWIDSSLQNGQVDKSGYPRPESIHTIGIVVDRTDEHITVARDFMGDDEYRGLCCIPMCCVRAITPMYYRGLALYAISREAVDAGTSAHESNDGKAEHSRKHLWIPEFDPENGSPTYQCKECGEFVKTAAWKECRGGSSS